MSFALSGSLLMNTCYCLLSLRVTPPPLLPPPQFVKCPFSISYPAAFLLVWDMKLDAISRFFLIYLQSTTDDMKLDAISRFFLIHLQSTTDDMKLDVISRFFLIYLQSTTNDMKLDVI